MEKYRIPLVNETGKTTGYGDRWWTHRVRNRREGLMLGQKHVGITIACLDQHGSVLTQHRKHKIFDNVWSLSGDTHPRKYEGRSVESLSAAATRCAKEDLGIIIKGWTPRLKLSYSARDPRDPRYCENELLYMLFARYGGPMMMNEDSAYELKWAQLAEISEDSRFDLKKEPANRKYAPWVHAAFSLSPGEVRKAFS